MITQIHSRYYDSVICHLKSGGNYNGFGVPEDLHSLNSEGMVALRVCMVSGYDSLDENRF